MILASIGVFLIVVLSLVIILLVAKTFLVSSGKVKITINDDKVVEVNSGSTLLNTLQTMAFTCHLLVEVRVHAVNANARYWKEEGRYFLLRFPISAENNRKTIGV